VSTWVLNFAGMNNLFIYLALWRWYRWWTLIFEFKIDII